MGFVASRQQTLARSLQRPALSELDAALKQLQSPTRDEIHEARKSCKRVRAWLRLLRKEIGPDVRAAETLVRDAARAVSGRRDADVVPQTLRKLRGTRALAKPQWRGLEVQLRRRLRRLRANSGRHGEVRAADLLRAARRLIEHWPPESLNETGVLRGLRKNYRRSRRMFQRCGRDSPPPDLHEWRKRCKQHYYQGQLLSRLWPGLHGHREHALDVLGEILGLHHDFEVLRGHLTHLRLKPGQAKSVARVLHLVEKRQRRLAGRALRVGQMLFAAKPRAWIAQLESS